MEKRINCIGLSLVGFMGFLMLLTAPLLDINNWIDVCVNIKFAFAAAILYLISISINKKVSLVLLCIYRFSLFHLAIVLIDKNNMFQAGACIVIIVIFEFIFKKKL